MATIKWFIRAVRLTGCVAAGYYFYKQFNEGSIGLSRFLMSSGVATIGCLAFFPSRAHEFHKSLSVLKANHSLMTNELDNLRDDLSSAKDFKDGVMNNSV